MIFALPHIVRIAIQLNYQLLATARKVCEIGPDLKLPGKVDATHLSVSEAFP
jgi:hypothetical protein